MIYLASPYSHPDPVVRQERFDAVCQAAAQLMRRGVAVFSPISHSHGITRFGLPTDWGFWRQYDTAFLSACRQLWVLMLPGWDTSVGVTAEIQLAGQLNKPVRYLDPVSLTIDETLAMPGCGRD